MKRILLPCLMLVSLFSFGTNPITDSIYTADPAALVYNDTVYIFCGHDEGTTGYIMNDWQCFSSADMVHWTSRGEVLTTADFSWSKGDAWAGQVIERNGKFYFYICTENSNGTGKAIGVAVANSPAGPYVDAIGSALVTNGMTTTISSTYDDIDPTVFIDNDGQAYLYWGNSQCYYAKLKENMIELDGDIVAVDIDTYTEAPYLHKKDSIYYLSYAYGWWEQTAYSYSTSITGPWTYGGVIKGVNENCNTNHQSIIEFKGQSYFIYHTGAIGGSYQRSVAVDYLFYNQDGSIRQVVPTPYGSQHIDSVAVCPPQITEPIYMINDQVDTARSFSVTEGDSLLFMPEIAATGTWSWEGSNSAVSSTTLSIKDISIDDAGIYLGIFTSSCGTKSYIDYDVTVNYKKTDKITSAGNYLIKSVVDTNLVVAVAKQRTTNGSNFIAETFDGNASQQFIITFISDVYWKVCPSNSTTRSMDVYNMSTDDGVNIDLWAYWGGSGQLWQIGEVATDTFVFKSKLSEKCIEIDTTDDNNIMQNTCADNDYQKFKIVAYTDTTSIISDKEIQIAKIYPNPTIWGNMTIEIPNDEVISEVKIYNIQGQCIFSQNNLNTTSYSPGIELKQGVYFVKVNSETTSYTGKIIAK